MQKRSLFEEVERDADRAHSGHDKIPSISNPVSLKPVRLLLAILIAMVVLMVFSGGITRHMDAGLSIADWRPLSNSIPPLSAEDWEHEFEKYKGVPEYRLQNFTMQLAEFKVIYWWEWWHRQLGRMIGLVWMIGFAGLLAAKKLPPGWTSRLLIVGGLGLLQGIVGWWMVSSGLSGNMLDVASYRLATHLLLAFVILCFLTWYYLCAGRSTTDLLQARRQKDNFLATASSAAIVLITLQSVLGALVAGIDAGTAFPTWPLMNGEFIPDNIFAHEPIWINFLENQSLVQFNHRTIGYVAALYLVVLWFCARRFPSAASNRTMTFLVLLVLLQILVGVMVVLTEAHMHLSLFHQLLAVLLLLTVVRASFLFKYPKMDKLKGNAQ